MDAETLFLRAASFNTGRFPQEPVLRSLMNYLLNSTYVDGYNQSARIGKTVRKYVEENGASKVNEYLKAFNYDFTIEYGSESEGEGLRVTVGSNQKSIFFMAKSSNSQLFFTSHDTNLVSNSVLRPDQINVVGFEGKKGSRVQRISVFKPREAQNLEKMYLGGMFEGLPVYEAI